MKNKDKILEIISHSHCGISATDIFESLENQMDKTTVYRNVEKMAKNGEILEQFDHNWEKKYASKHHHHHHFVCNECGKKINIWCFFSDELKKLETKENITIVNHSLLLQGVCGECRK